MYETVSPESKWGSRAYRGEPPARAGESPLRGHRSFSAGFHGGVLALRGIGNHWKVVMFESFCSERATADRNRTHDSRKITVSSEEKIRSICLYDFGHPVRVYMALKFLGNELGFPQKYRELVRVAALFHDVGKMLVLDEILNRPTKLSEQEMDKMRKHPIMGHRIMRSGFYQLSKPLVTLASCVALKHHERLDGSGYPHQLRGDDIPEAVRAVTIVDIYDALRSWRPYRPSLAPDDAWDILICEKGLDFRMLKAFSKVRQNIEKHVYRSEILGIRDVGEILSKAV